MDSAYRLELCDELGSGNTWDRRPVLLSGIQLAVSFRDRIAFSRGLAFAHAVRKVVLSD
jgi:hypothetical protein